MKKMSKIVIGTYIIAMVFFLGFIANWYLVQSVMLFWFMFSILFIAENLGLILLTKEMKK